MCRLGCKLLSYYIYVYNLEVSRSLLLCGIVLYVHAYIVRTCTRLMILCCSACPKSCTMDVYGRSGYLSCDVIYDVPVTYQHTLAVLRRGRLLANPISHIFWTRCAMVSGCMMFGNVVCLIFAAWAPKDVKLLSRLSVTEPMIPHIP